MSPDDGGPGESPRDEPAGALSFSSLGLVAQPIVWTSLYSVLTTGAGLPPGPFGIVGALEGVSYLAVVFLVGRSVYRKWTPSVEEGGRDGLAEGLSRASLAAGLLVLATLAAREGCVPNAKPILDYSAYVPVCSATPGLFGG